MKKYTLILLTVIATLTAFADRYDHTYRVVDPITYNINSANSASQAVENCNYLTYRNIPPLSNQPETLKFTLESTPGQTGVSHLPIIWFTLGKSSYHYTYENIDGTVYRLLYLYSSDFPSQYLALSIPNNYSGACLVLFVNSNTGKTTETQITGSQAADFFKMIARKVRDLHIPKKNQDTLFIDIDF